MPNCPTDIELTAFLNDALPGERAGSVGGHIDGCSLCQARLDKLVDQSKGAGAKLKLSSVVLSNAPSGTPDTHVIGRPPPVAALVGLPRVRGFDVIAEIGRGGMGVVYRARHLRLNRLVALKMILAGTAADPRDIQRFLFEAEYLARIQHPQVVQVYEVDMYQGPTGVPIPYLAMELLEGGSLHRRLKLNGPPESGGAPRWPTLRGAAELVEGLARAVHAAHLQGVIHRDLKPGNILFPADSGQPAVGRPNQEKTVLSSLPTAHSALPTAPKVLDFGLAKLTREGGTGLTQTGQIIGTPQYMAPEQAAGRAVTPAVDVYSLGAILFECLSGRPPFLGQEPVSVLMKVVNEPAPDVRELRPDVPRDLAAVTMKCLEKDPARRYDSAAALADDLRRFLDARPTLARPVPAAWRGWLWAKRNPTAATLTVALVAVLLLGLGAIAALVLDARKEADLARTEQANADHARHEAERAHAEAIAANERTAAALRTVQHQKALLEFQRGISACEEGRVEEGLSAFLVTLQLAEDTGDTDLARVARVNLAAWPRELPPPSRPFAHRTQPRLAAFHPDGVHFATAGRSGEAYLWNGTTGAKVRTFRPAGRFIPIPGFLDSTITYWTVAISPDGTTLAAAGTDGALTLWKIDLSNPIETIPPAGTLDRGAEVWSVAFAPDGALWCTDTRGAAKIDVSDRARPRVVARPAAPLLGVGDRTVQILAVAPDGSRVYTGDRTGTVREWDAATATQRNKWEYRGWIVDLAVSPDGTRLAATGTDGAVWLIDLTRGEKESALRLAGAYGNGVAFAGKSPTLAVSDGDGNLRFWRADTGQPIGVPLRFRGEVTRPRFRPGTDELAIPAGNTMFLTRAPAWPGEAVAVGGGARTRGLDFGPHGHLAYTREMTGRIVPPDGGAAANLPPNRGARVLRHDPEPTRPFVYIGVRDGFERITADGTTLVSVKSSHELGRVNNIECLRDGLYASGSKSVARFDPVTLTRTALKQPTNDFNTGIGLDAMTVRADGAEVLVTSSDRVLFLKGDTLERIREWKATDEILSARYTPDGTKVLLGRRDNVAELLDAVRGEPTGARPMPHTGAVAAVAVGRNGELLLTGCRDGTARFWDATTGLPLGPPLRHAAAVTHVAFAPKGDRVATGTGNGQVTTWGLPAPPTTDTIEELTRRYGPK